MSIQFRRKIVRTGPIIDHQRQRIARAYRKAGAVAVEGFREVMLGIIDDEDRPKFSARIDRAATTKR